MIATIEDLTKIFSRAFGQDVIINATSKRSDIEFWDSINKLNLVVELEDFYKVSFTQQEIEEMNSVQFIIEVLAKK
jgi:acyl carrier protein